ncbi:MAG: outer membrane lipoprotein carrier protein LolA [Planctomycetota bacterium]
MALAIMSFRDYRVMALAFSFVLSGYVAAAESIALSETPIESEDAWPRLVALLQASDDDLDAHAGTRGRFEQRRTSMLLAEPLVSSGTFAVVQGHARFHTLTPHPSVMRVTPLDVTIFDLETGTEETYERDPERPIDPSTDLLGMLLSRDLAALQAAYAATTAEATQRGTVAFLLTSRISENDTDRPLPDVTLELGQVQGEPRRLLVTQADGDALELRFFDLVADAELTPETLATEDSGDGLSTPKARP